MLRTSAFLEPPDRAGYLLLMGPTMEEVRPKQAQRDANKEGSPEDLSQAVRGTCIEVTKQDWPQNEKTRRVLIDEPASCGLCHVNSDEPIMPA